MKRIAYITAAMLLISSCVMSQKNETKNTITVRDALNLSDTATFSIGDSTVTEVYSGTLVNTDYVTKAISEIEFEATGIDSSTIVDDEWTKMIIDSVYFGVNCWYVKKLGVASLIIGNTGHSESIIFNGYSHGFDITGSRLKINPFGGGSYYFWPDTFIYPDNVLIRSSLDTVADQAYVRELIDDIVLSENPSSGDAGDVQFSDGANGFFSDPNLTWSAGNDSLILTGILTVTDSVYFTLLAHDKEIGSTLWVSPSGNVQSDTITVNAGKYLKKLTPGPILRYVQREFGEIKWYGYNGPVYEIYSTTPNETTYKLQASDEIAARQIAFNRILILFLLGYIIYMRKK